MRKIITAVTSIAASAAVLFSALSAVLSGAKHVSAFLMPVRN